jgi:hypothetical protein
MKPRGAGKLDFADEIPFEPLASDVAIRAADLHCVWFSEPTPAARSRKVYGVVAPVVSAVWHRDRLGYVPILALRIPEKQAARKCNLL